MEIIRDEKFLCLKNNRSPVDLLMLKTSTTRLWVQKVQDSFELRNHWQKMVKNRPGSENHKWLLFQQCGLANRQINIKVNVSQSKWWTLRTSEMEKPPVIILKPFKWLHWLWGWESHCTQNPHDLCPSLSLISLCCVTPAKGNDHACACYWILHISIRMSFFMGTVVSLSLD